MRLLIDGYNLLFASDVFAPLGGPATLERTRQAFLEFLTQSIDDKVRTRTTIVFDATQAPPGLPHERLHAGMRLLFSRNPSDADTLIEDLLERDRAPRELLVISSDHRVQRAARQRGAKYIDSESWYRELERSRREADLAKVQQKPSGDVAPSDEMQRWLAEFSDVDPRELEPKQEVPAKPTSPPQEPPATGWKPAKDRQKKRSREEKPLPGSFNPFPPGYGEDVEDDEG